MIQIARKAYESGNTNLALKMYLQEYESEPQNLEVLEGLVRSYNRLGKSDEASKYCKLALDIKSTLVWPHCVLSFINFRNGQIEASKSEALLALQLEQDESEPNYVWGNLLFQENKVEDALLFLERAASIDPNDWYVYNSLSSVYLKKGDLKRHYEALKQMNRLKPNLFLTLRIHIGRYSMFYGVSLVLLHYIPLVLSVVLQIPVLLLLPALIDVLLIIMGSIILFSSRYVGGRAGFIAVAIGFIQGLVIFLLFHGMH